MISATCTHSRIAPGSVRQNSAPCLMTCGRKAATFDAGMQEIARYARDGDALRRFYGLPMPRVYVAGDKIARGDLDSLERNGVEIRRFPGAGHAVMFDEPDGFYAFLTKWATKVVGEARV